MSVSKSGSNQARVRRTDRKCTVESALHNQKIPISLRPKENPAIFYWQILK